MGQENYVPDDPGLSEPCERRRGAAVPIALAVALAVAISLAIAGPQSGAVEVVVLNLGAFSLVGTILVLAHRCEMYVSGAQQAQVPGPVTLTAAEQRAVTDASPVALMSLGLPPVPAVVGAGIDPATSHFSGARSTN